MDNPLKITGYHFVGPTLRDGKPIPPNGEWLIHDGPIVPCESGLHASEHPFDALQHAPGETLCLVELEGDLASHGNPIDKWAGRRRKIIKRIDATNLLRRFAADQALSVKHLWDMPPVVMEYLTTLDETKRAAAWDTAWDTALAAARAAARDAAWAAARAAARDAARDAARTEFKNRVDLAFA